MSDSIKETTIVLPSGSVEYSLDDAAVEIDDLIELLQEAKNDGATHVVASSGNYRGAQWARIGGYSGYSWAADDE